MGLLLVTPSRMAMGSPESDSVKPTPEQVKAISILEKNLPKWKDRGCVWESALELHQDDIAFFKGHLTTKNIRHESHWYWNQTKARRRHTVRETGELVYYWKIIPRRAKKVLRNDVNLPPTRVWVYHVTLLSSEGDYSTMNATMVWCQQGTVEISSVPYDPPVSKRNQVPTLPLRTEPKAEAMIPYPPAHPRGFRHHQRFRVPSGPRSSSPCGRLVGFTLIPFSFICHLRNQLYHTLVHLWKLDLNYQPFNCFGKLNYYCLQT